MTPEEIIEVKPDLNPDGTESDFAEVVLKHTEPHVNLYYGTIDEVKAVADHILAALMRTAWDADSRASTMEKRVGILRINRDDWIEQHNAIENKFDGMKRKLEKARLDESQIEGRIKSAQVLTGGLHVDVEGIVLGQTVRGPKHVNHRIMAGSDLFCPLCGRETQREYTQSGEGEFVCRVDTYTCKECPNTNIARKVDDS